MCSRLCVCECAFVSVCVFSIHYYAFRLVRLSRVFVLLEIAARTRNVIVQCAIWRFMISVHIVLTPTETIPNTVMIVNRASRCVCAVGVWKFIELRKRQMEIRVPSDLRINHR